jgi:hypothetical protein
MKSILGMPLVIAAFCGALLGHARAGDAEAGAQPSAPRDTVDEFVVTAKALGELRLRIKLAEDEVYARFNDINSNDRFDIHCEPYTPTGSHIVWGRACLSNGWRMWDAEAGRAMLFQTSSESGPGPQIFRAQQLLEQRQLNDEMRRLAHEDPAFGQALIRLGQAHLALEVITGSGATWTMYREIPAGADGLPFDAQRMVDVRVGNAPWRSPLTHRTFTLTGVSGRVSNLSLECDHTGKKPQKLAFEDEKEWTLPAAWGACTLTVAAKRNTTFRFVEFD